MTALNIKNDERRNVGFFRSIRGQIMLRMLLLGLVPLVAMGIVAYLTARSALDQAVQDNLDSLTSNKAVEIANWITDTRHVIELIADLPAIIGDIDPATHSGVEDVQHFKNTLDGEYRSAYNEALNTLNAFVAMYHTKLDGVFLISSDGKAVVSTMPGLLPEGTDAKDVPTFSFEKALQGTYLSDLELSIDGTSNVFVGATPVIDRQGKTVGVVAMRVNTSELQSLLNTTVGLGDTGETYMVDTSSKLMISQSRFSEENTMLKQEVDSEATRQALNGIQSGHNDYTNYRDHAVVGSWAMVEGTDWLVVAEIDQSKAYAAANTLAEVVALAVVITTGAILAVSYLVARTLSQPIIQLTRSAIQIAGGNLDERVESRSKNEIGILARTFNNMTGDLQTMVETERESKAYLERTISEYMEFVEKVSGGNLAVRLQLNGNGYHHGEAEDDLYRLGVNLNQMVGNLYTMARQVREVAVSVTSAATEIQAAATQQVASAVEQDAAVTQTVATVEEVRATVLQTSERAQSVANFSQESVNVSRTGEDAVANTNEGMLLIRQRVESIAETILMLSERTQQIGEIIDTVNAVADQSKLLALNASIEAARAGEEGKGFAVVAMEVRQLAEQSREATARVRDILNEIQKATNTAVMVTEEGSKGADAGMVLVEQAGLAIQELAGTIEEAAQSAMQIAASTHQQTNGMDQLAQAMMQIKQASVQTAASMRQTEQSVHDLMEMARQLEYASASYQLNLEM